MILDIKFWIASGDKLKNVISAAYRLQMIKQDLHVNHLLGAGPEILKRMQIMQRDIEDNPKKLHYMVAEGGFLGTSNI